MGFGDNSHRRTKRMTVDAYQQKRGGGKTTPIDILQILEF